MCTYTCNTRSIGIFSHITLGVLYLYVRPLKRIRRRQFDNHGLQENRTTQCGCGRFSRKNLNIEYIYLVYNTLFSIICIHLYTLHRIYILYTNKAGFIILELIINKLRALLNIFPYSLVLF